LVFESESRLERIEASSLAITGLTSIVIPSRVTSIDGSAFVALSLDSMTISPDNTNFRVYEWFLEDFDGSTIYRYFGACRSVVIPSRVIVLAKSSFNCCMSLESVIFEDGSRLERIEQLAFHKSGLDSIAIPSSVIVLGTEAFRGCKSLKSVIFENGSRLERIDESAFRESRLDSIVIPASVVFVDDSAFDRRVTVIRSPGAVVCSAEGTPPQVPVPILRRFFSWRSLLVVLFMLFFSAWIGKPTVYRRSWTSRTDRHLSSIPDLGRDAVASGLAGT
jgi:hypothetical protein